MNMQEPEVQLLGEVELLSAPRAAWPRVRFGDVVRLNTDRAADPLAAGIERFVGLEHIEPENLRIRRWGLVAEGTTFTNLFRPGQVLFGKRRAYQRKVGLADFEGVCSSDIYVFETKDSDVLLPALLPFLCQTDGFFEHAVGTSAGSLSPRTNWTQLAAYEFALPPLEEQRRLVMRLLSLEQVHRHTQEASTKAQQLWVPAIRRLMGVEGSEEETSIVQCNRHVTSVGWPVVRLTEVCVTNRQDVQVGPFGGSVSSQYFALVGVPILKINNITDTGDLDLSGLVYLNKDQAKAIGDRYTVYSGDVITAAQATIGRTAIINSEASGAIISQHLIRIAVNPALCLPEWLHACFHSPLLLRQIHSAVQGGTRAGLNTNDVRNLLVPLPPLEKQSEFCLNLRSITGAARSLEARNAQTIRALKYALQEMAAV
jgi:type I restriction enzyme S subunit